MLISISVDNRVYSIELDCASVNGADVDQSSYWHTMSNWERSSLNLPVVLPWRVTTTISGRVVIATSRVSIPSVVGGSAPAAYRTLASKRHADARIINGPSYNGEESLLNSKSRKLTFHPLFVKPLRRRRGACN